jgi:hypothetical protein
MTIPDEFFARFGQTHFGSGGDVDNFFTTTLRSDFPSWFNANLANRGAWAGFMLKGAPGFVDFHAFCGALVAVQSRSLLEVLAYIGIGMNETGGSFRPVSEGYNGPKGPHPGICYLFDSYFVAQPNGNGFHKKSYNTSPNRTAGSLFNDEAFNNAHGTEPLGSQLANTKDAVWNGETYPQGNYPTDGVATEMGYILEADFFKYRGRGFIQTTFRSGYRPLVSFVQDYAGEQPVILRYKEQWAGHDPDLICTTSATADWDTLFQQTGLIVAAAALLTHAKGGGYLPLSSDPATANGTATGSVEAMGQRIGGTSSYGEKFLDRVAQMATALVATAPAVAAQ